MQKAKTKKLLEAIVSPVLAGIMMVSVAACNGSQGKAGPQGPQGIQGVQGDKGEKGDTPFIGKNGNWWVGDVDTGVNAGTAADPLVALNETKAPISKNVSAMYSITASFIPTTTI